MAEKTRQDWNGQFRDRFIERFQQRFGNFNNWIRSQGKANCAALLPNYQLKRIGCLPRADEAFEIGDLRADFAHCTLIVEYDSGAISLSNLLKYWPYVRGEVAPLSPRQPIVLCHFSSWRSYASYRYLWEWTLGRIQQDPFAKVAITGKQFDHCGDPGSKMVTAIDCAALEHALDWIEPLVIDKAA